MQSNREIEKEVDGFWHFCLTVNSNWNDQHSNKIAAKPFSDWLIVAALNKKTFELEDPAIFLCTITILSTIFKFNWFVDGFFNPVPGPCSSPWLPCWGTVLVLDWLVHVAALHLLCWHTETGSSLMTWLPRFTLSTTAAPPQLSSLCNPADFTLTEL